VNERQRASGLQDVRGREEVGRGSGVVVVELGEVGGPLQVSPLEDRDGAGQSSGGLGEAIEPQHDRTADGAGPDPLDHRRRGRRRGDHVIA
jgi:hypothetical protein